MSIKSIQRLYGIVKLDEPLICFSDVLGLSQKIAIGGISGFIHLPKFSQKNIVNDSGFSPRLTAPKYAKNFKCGNDKIYWGRLIQYHQDLTKDFLCTAEIHEVLITFDVNEVEIINSGNSIRNNFDGWFKLFVNYVYLVTKQNRDNNIEINQKSVNLDFFYWGNDKKAVRPYDDAPSEISITMRDDQTTLTKKQFKKICTWISENKELSIEFLIQLEAYSAHKNKDYRKAIIETAVASEIAITKAIQEYFSAKNISYSDDLIKKFRMLGGRIELANILGIVLPKTDLSKLLVEPRNDVIHKAKFANQSVSMSAIQITDEILKLYNPNLFTR